MNSDPLSESNTRNANGNMPCKSLTAPMTHFDALLRMEAFSVHPVAISVNVRVRANSPWNEGPQCATVSASTHPGAVTGTSPTFDKPIELRSRGDGIVVEIPRNCIARRAGAK